MMTTEPTEQSHHLRDEEAMDAHDEYFGERRDHTRRRLIRWDPSFSSGTVAIIMTWVVSMGGVYGVYTADKRDQENKTAQLRHDVDANQAELSKSLESIRGEVKEVSRTLQDVSTNIAVLKARQDPMLRRAAPEERR
jgi:hypothetical protein